MYLFCIPYAGGSQTAYYKWRNGLDPSIQLEAIELKGRGKRINEIFYRNFEEAVNDIFDIIEDKIIKDDYAIYGHSMGSLLAYELYYKINSKKLRKPKHIFFSGQNAPNNVNKGKLIHNLPNDEFMKEIMELGGTPKELLESKELLELFIPIMRNDFSILEKYIYMKKQEKIDCDISILSGKEDSIHSDDICVWKEHASKNVNIYEFEGDHFFIHNNLDKIIHIINTTIL